MSDENEQLKARIAELEVLLNEANGRAADEKDRFIRASLRAEIGREYTTFEQELKARISSLESEVARLRKEADDMRAASAGFDMAVRSFIRSPALDHIRGHIRKDLAIVEPECDCDRIY